jgi:CCR4-NOT transcription complex subunit 1
MYNCGHDLYFLLVFIQGPGSRVGNVGLQLARRPGSPESLQQLIEIARNNVSTTTGFVVGKDEKVKLSKDKKVYDLI